MKGSLMLADNRNWIPNGTVALLISHIHMLYLISITQYTCASPSQSTEQSGATPNMSNTIAIVFSIHTTLHLQKVGICEWPPVRHYHVTLNN